MQRRVYTADIRFLLNSVAEQGSVRIHWRFLSYHAHNNRGWPVGKGYAIKNLDRHIDSGNLMYGRLFRCSAK